MAKVSVIIPVFNMELYLEQCLNSCQNSTLKDLEFICINDGSTDNSLAILQKYAANDSRFKIYSQPNQGQGIARNNALKLVTGEYIAFVDPDDWVETTLFEKAYQCAKLHQADVVQFNYVEYRENKKKFKPISLEKKFKKEYCCNLKKAGKYTPSNIPYGLFYNLYNQVWNRLYKTDFIRQHNIHFSTTRNGEDHLFTIGVFVSTPVVYYLRDYLYTYRVRMGSSCHQWSEKDIDYTFDNIKQIQNYLVQHNLLKQYQTAFEDYCIQNLYWVKISLLSQAIPAYEKQVASFLAPHQFAKYQQLCQGPSSSRKHYWNKILQYFKLFSK